MRPVLLFAVLLLAACGSSQPPSARSDSPAGVVLDGKARFQVLTPTLIRLEYAEDGRFEDGPTQTVISRALPVPAFESSVENGERVIRTAALTLRYRQESGPFGADNLVISLRRGEVSVDARPDWSIGPKAGNLGGWRRSLDNEQDPQPLHDGLLSRAGWYLLDDTRTALLVTQPPGFTTRPARTGPYQDGYFFGYGLDFRQALSDLKAITGAAPLLPRKALGVWFSRYWTYDEAEWRELVAQFRAHGVPLDTLSVDTDWKVMHYAPGCIFFDAVSGARPGDPCSWNGWDWNRDLYPDPRAFLAWLHAEGIEVGLNIHPSINGADARYPETFARTGPLMQDDAQLPCTLLQADPFNPCYVFDWTVPAQLDAYFALHAPIAADGVDFWWLDWCCEGSRAIAPGLTADTWINAQYHAAHEAMGSRWPAFSRIGSSFQEGKAGAGNNGLGAFAEHRHTLHFTGDACGTWQMLAFEAQLTAAEGGIGMPYVSHDIGSFLGEPVAGVCNGTVARSPHLPDEMYVRWLQFGTFQPLLRLHSHHGDRLPWEYPGAAETIATEFLRLRSRLVPYLYTLSRQAHDTGLPMVRALYLQWPEHEEAYAHPTEFTLGDDVLVATVAVAGDPAGVTVWIPPGAWVDWFTGERHVGPATVTLQVPLARYPVFLREGAIVPTGTPQAPTLEVQAGAPGRFELYEDEGRGFGYRNGAHAWTDITTATDGGCTTVDIAPTRGEFPGILAARTWTIQLRGVDAPASVRINGQAVAASPDAARRVLTIETGVRTSSAALHVAAGPAGCS